MFKGFKFLLKVQNSQDEGRTFSKDYELKNDEYRNLKAFLAGTIWFDFETFQKI